MDTVSRSNTKGFNKEAETMRFFSRDKKSGSARGKREAQVKKVSDRRQGLRPSEHMPRNFPVAI